MAPALATFSRKAFLSDSMALCVCVRAVCTFVYDRGVWVILSERAVKASVTGAPVLC